MSHFFALLSRMKYINRWGLMRNTRSENIAEHSLEVAVIAHALAELRNRRFGGQVDVGRVLQLAVYHDVAEIFTGDLPTPVKYYNSEIRKAYRQVERHALQKMVRGLPEDLQPVYRDLLLPDGKDAPLLQIVKAADKLSALIKCMEEASAGNTEFRKAAAAQRRSIEEMHLPEADCFIREFLPSYSLTLDELD